MRKLLVMGCFAVLLTVGAFAATYLTGSYVISVPAGTSTTGAGATYFFQGVYNKYTWQVVVSGGTATAITTNFECSLDGGTTYSQFDQSTSTSGEVRSVVNKPSLGCRCNVAVYTVNGTTASCGFVASADPR